jgi:hypothetical protein
MKELEIKWNSLSIAEREFVIETLFALYPEKKKIINEAEWWNTLGDIVGIFDPTGVVDIVNGLDYMRQGDHLFGLLSMISAVPYLGDLFAKPVIGVMKLGGEGAKILRGIKTSSDVASAGAKIPEFGKFLNKSDEILPEFIQILKKGEKIPVIGGLIKVINEWITLLFNGAKEYKLGRSSSKTVTKGSISAEEKISLLNSIKDILKPGAKTKTFRTYKDLDPSLWSKYVVGGVGRVWGNRSVRSLMRRTKWYLGLLDYLGIANFVGPDELEAKLGKNTVLNGIEKYSQTPQSKQAWEQDVSGSDLGQEIKTKTETKPEKDVEKFNFLPQTDDILGMMIKQLFI